MDLSFNHYDTQRGFQIDARSQSGCVQDQPIRGQVPSREHQFEILLQHSYKRKKVSRQKNKSFYHMIEKK